MKIGRDLKIVFMGTPDFAAHILQRLVDGRYNIAAVVTVPDRPAGRGRQLTPSAVKNCVTKVNEVRASHGESPIALLQPEKLRSEDFLTELRAIDADLFIVVAFRMLPEVVWSMPRRGTFNLHASLLPHYRGAAPINHAIINGETKTGVTTFFLNDRIDCGEIIERVEVDILDDDNAGTLHDKLMIAGADLVLHTVDRIAQGGLQTIAQSDNENPAKAAPKIFKDFCELNFEDSVENLHNKVRGLSPYPAAWCEIQGVEVDGMVKEAVVAKIFATHYSVDDQKITTGTWKCDAKSYLAVRGLDGWLYIDQLQPQSKKPMAIADFLRGWRGTPIDL